MFDVDPFDLADPLHSESGDLWVAHPLGDACLTEQMALADPLVGLSTYRFPAFVLVPESDVLVDTDGDGVADRTVWGTPVEYVESYTRSDGTIVRGHYRTVADGQAWNNLR